MTTADPDDLLDLVLRELRTAIDRSGSPANVVPTASTKLMGSNAPLDSVGLVSLILGLENAIEARYGVRLELADERAMSRRPSPFRSTATMASYIAERLASARP